MGALLLVLLMALVLFGLAFTVEIGLRLVLASVVLLVGKIRPAQDNRFCRWGYR